MAVAVAEAADNEGAGATARAACIGVALEAVGNEDGSPGGKFCFVLACFELCPKKPAVMASLASDSGDLPLASSDPVFKPINEIQHHAHGSITASLIHSCTVEETFKHRWKRSDKKDKRAHAAAYVRSP